MQINAPSSTANETDTESGFVAFIDIVSYSRGRGSKQIKDLNLEIYNALHRWSFPDTASYCISTINQL